MKKSRTEKPGIEDTLRELAMNKEALLAYAKEMMGNKNKDFTSFLAECDSSDMLEFMQKLDKLSQEDAIVDHLALYLEFQKKVSKTEGLDDFERFLQEKQQILGECLTGEVYVGESARRQKMSLDRRATYLKRTHRDQVDEYVNSFSDQKLAEIFETFLKADADSQLNFTGELGNDKYSELFARDDKMLKVALLHNISNKTDTMLYNRIMDKLSASSRQARAVGLFQPVPAPVANTSQKSCCCTLF